MQHCLEYVQYAALRVTTARGWGWVRGRNPNPTHKTTLVLAVSVIFQTRWNL